jgi:serine/threonine protein kinase/spermidine/putrescine-binding protein
MDMGLSDVWKRDLRQGRGPEDPLPEEPEGAEDPLIGQVIGERYIVESVLGMGGMGVLYLARHRTLGRKFVIKLIRLSQGGNLRMERERFFREAKTIARVNHPNVVDVVDYEFLDATTPYIVMEMIEGKDLAEFLAENHLEGMPLSLFLDMMRQICDAVSAIHKAGIVHRDLKPKNIMVTQLETGYRLKILDFGLAHIAEGEESMKLTATGVIMGTPIYMAPEQCLGREITAATDVYALGLIAYEMLLGHPPFAGKSIIEIAHKQAKELPEPPLNKRPELPAEMNGAVLAALAKEPTERPASAQDFFQALVPASMQDTQTFASSSLPVQGRREPQVVVAKPFPRGMAALFLFVLAGLSGWWWLARKESAPASAAAALQMRADALWQEGQKDQALDLYLQLFELDPLNPLFEGHVAEYVQFKDKFHLGSGQMLRLLNWENYLGHMTSHTFRMASGISLSTTTYDRIEAIRGKLESDQPDLIIVGEGMIRELMAEDLLLPLSADKLNRLDHLEPAFASMSYDPGNRYSVPYVWGTLGLYYNPKSFPNPPSSWASLFKPENLQGKQVILPDYPREIHGLALKYLGYSYNELDEARLAEARDLVARAFPHWQVVGTEQPLRKRLLAGGVDLALVWSGFAQGLAQEGLGMVFAMPEEGGNLSIDSLAIPRSSRNVEGAHAFINHVLHPPVAADLSRSLHYAVPNKQARAFLDKWPLSRGIQPDLSRLLNCDFDTEPSRVLEGVLAAWEELKQGKQP